MTGHHNVNPERVYYNFQGRMPPVVLEQEPAVPPPDSPHTTPKYITDTTLRDGTQDPRFALFPAPAKLRYVELLHELDNGTGVIEAVEVFIYQKRDLWVLEQLLKRGYDTPQITTWTRATPKDIKLLSGVSGGRIKETGMLASSSDHHIFDKLGFRSKEEAIEKYLVPILAACDQGVRPRIHLEDATRADIYGWVIPFMHRVLEETKGQARFRICDTLGIGVADPCVSIPFGIPKLISTLVQETGAELEFHGHNDFGCATSNSLAAYLYGCKRVNVAFAGLGERTGNTPLEQVLANYIRLYGDPGFNLGVLVEIADLINRDVIAIPAKQPMIGSGIFTTQAGLHQTGIERQRHAEGGLIYLPFEPSLMGREDVEFNLVGGVAGMDGIVAMLNAAVERETGQPGRYTLTSRAVKRVYDKVQEAYDGEFDERGQPVNYRTTFFSSAEILALAREAESARGGTG